MNDPEDIVRIAVRVPPALRREVRALAEAAGMTLQAFVNEALTEHLARCEDGGWITDDAPPGKQSPPPTITTSRRNR